ncbi:MAG TPA: nucleoside triphosphate pyrophosphohydrolase [Thermoanaerobaculia bacterium]|nr:nucleoside triphosphate pyrophosphohydrolase [Thermoanaerobaculia bacterium]
MTLPGAADGFRALVDLVHRLRAPDGCPWDRQQRLADARGYLLEEAHEAAAALDAGDWPQIAEELGDLLFQAAFLVALGEERGTLDAAGVLRAAGDKMVARHPHVFAGEELADAAAVQRAWERRKVGSAPGGLLGGVPRSLPALLGAYRLSQKAAGVGFDWPDAAAVLAKVHEELGELEAEMPAAGRDDARLGEEMGDLLFALASLARQLEIEPEAALAAANDKFRRRFARIEARLTAAGQRLGEVTLDRLEELWQGAKAEEASGPGPSPEEEA